MSKNRTVWSRSDVGLAEWRRSKCLLRCKTASSYPSLLRIIWILYLFGISFHHNSLGGPGFGTTLCFHDSRHYSRHQRIHSMQGQKLMSCDSGISVVLVIYTEQTLIRENETYGPKVTDISISQSHMLKMTCRIDVSLQIRAFFFTEVISNKFHDCANIFIT